ncbi:MAG: phospholipid-binding protein MlaC [Alphaproteobacteria bacterium]
MVRRSVLILLVCAALGALAGPVNAGPAEDSARVFVKSLADRALSTLKSDVSKQDRDRQFHAILAEGFDVPAIARFSLGAYWEKASEADRQEYLKLFQDLIVQTYSARLSSVYNGQRLDIGAARPDGKIGMWVASKIVSPNPADESVRIDWRLRQPGGDKHKVVDVVVNNISMVVTQRDDFVAALQGNGGDVRTFLGVLREKIVKLQSGT